jgi:glycosyltransferase involved in cell wall biosynthesis
MFICAVKSPAMKKKLRIAQVAPLYESVPPKMYGGTERVVSFLTEALVADGHTVTLYATGDSASSARLVPVIDRALRLNEQKIDQVAPHIAMLQLVQDDLHKFDIVHYHIDYLHFPVSRKSIVPTVTTLHGRLDIPELQTVYNTFREAPVISISNAQRVPLPQANWRGTVYHGLPVDLLKFYPAKGKYLAFLGRVSPEKGLDQAIDIALGSGLPLKIAAKLDTPDRDYFERHIKAKLEHPLIEYVGEVNEPQKNDFLGNAMALLFPIQWEEPFGLVMIEAMACGTPVVAYPRGSVLEIMSDSRSGVIAGNINEAIKAVKNIDRIKRQGCRDVFEERFSVERMLSDYLKIYQKEINLPVSDINLNPATHEFH